MGTEAARKRTGRRRAPEDFWTVHVGDSRRLEEVLAPYSSPADPLLMTTVTSPPYGNLKDYGHAAQIGFGQSHEEYLTECRRIFRSIALHTKDEGSLWLIVDTLTDKRSSPRRLQPLPFQLAAQATQAGWILREVIVWKKDKTLPWSGRGRLRNTFEYVLFLVKSDAFKFNIDRLRDALELEEWWVRYPERYNPQGKVPTNVWEIPIPVQGSWANTAIQHACPLPPNLVERLVLLTTDEDDVVFDPFAGSGVVVAEAERLRRRALGIEINPRHVEAFNGLVRPEILQRRGRDELAERMTKSAVLHDLILKLRALKYPRVLSQQLAASFPHLPRPVAAFVELVSLDVTALRQPHKLIECKTTFVVSDSAEVREEVHRALKELTTKPPASKFGVEGEISVVGSSALPDQREVWFLYPNGRTWKVEREVSAEALPLVVAAHLDDRFPPVFGDVMVDETPRALRPADPAGR